MASPDKGRKKTVASDASLSQGKQHNHQVVVVLYGCGFFCLFVWVCVSLHARLSMFASHCCSCGSMYAYTRVCMSACRHVCTRVCVYTFMNIKA